METEVKGVKVCAQCGVRWPGRLESTGKCPGCKYDAVRITQYPLKPIPMAHKRPLSR